MKCYLAGPITGKTYDQAVSWREWAQRELAASGIESYSPMRCKEELFGQNCLSAYDYPLTGPLSGQAMFARDVYDVRTCDILLACFVGADQVSAGTMFELGLAWGLGKYVVVVMEDHNPHKHIFVSQAAAVVFMDLVEAVEWIGKVYGGQDK